MNKTVNDDRFPYSRQSFERYQDFSSNPWSPKMFDKSIKLTGKRAIKLQPKLINFDHSRFNFGGINEAGAFTKRNNGITDLSSIIK